MSQLTPEFKKELLDFLKENLSLHVSESSDIVDCSHGEYKSQTTFKISLYLGEDKISEESIYTS